MAYIPNEHMEGKIIVLLIIFGVLVSYGICEGITKARLEVVNKLDSSILFINNYY